MASKGEQAPDFTAPLANGELGGFTLSDHLADEAPIVLAFFPGAFTSTCQHEMNTFQSRLSELEDSGATIYGISIDTPFALNEFREQLGLEFGLISDTNRALVNEYGVNIDSPDLGIDDLANRAVFVIDSNQEITYAWIADDPTNEPDYDAVIAAATDA